MIVDAPPGMQPWIRQVNNRLGNVERSAERLTAKASGGGPVTGRYAETPDYLVAPFGTTAGWAKMPASSGPVLLVTTDTGLLKVTVGCWMGLVGGADMTGVCAMTFSVDNSMTSVSDLGGESGLAYLSGLPSVIGDSGSKTRVIRVPIGTHTIMSEYLYQHFNPTVEMVWAHRYIIAEPF